MSHVNYYEYYSFNAAFSLFNSLSYSNILFLVLFMVNEEGEGFSPFSGLCYTLGDCNLNGRVIQKLFIRLSPNRVNVN